MAIEFSPHMKFWVQNSEAENNGRTLVPVAAAFALDFGPTAKISSIQIPWLTENFILEMEQNWKYQNHIELS